MGHDHSRDVVFVTAESIKAPILEEGLISACRAPRSLDLQPRGSQCLAQQVQPQPCLPPPLCNAGTEPWSAKLWASPSSERKIFGRSVPHSSFSAPWLSVKQPSSREAGGKELAVPPALSRQGESTLTPGCSAFLSLTMLMTFTRKMVDIVTIGQVLILCVLKDLQHSSKEMYFSSGFVFPTFRAEVGGGLGKRYQHEYIQH